VHYSSIIVVSILNNSTLTSFVPLNEIVDIALKYFIIFLFNIYFYLSSKENDSLSQDILYGIAKRKLISLNSNTSGKRNPKESSENDGRYVSTSCPSWLIQENMFFFMFLPFLNLSRKWPTKMCRNKDELHESGINLKHTGTLLYTKIYMFFKKQ
jgi:hypothetical protein